MTHFSVTISGSSNCHSNAVVCRVLLCVIMPRFGTAEVGADEMKDAEAKVRAASPTELKRMKASMAHWLKAHGENAGKGLRGEERLQWLVQYEATRMATKSAKAVTKTNTDFVEKRRDAREFGWFCFF